ncbi:hypothetical protein RF11_03024 [Thelohanellus kitauei]|uniref:Uncharacterized protein n=1 Tax=Thelohanellus kitauei TaxID=669202 RepID=A0A0C2N2Q3_THEKT|nr:hypothetical protein RF11_03024 [Thelohanellus kitauei]
MKFNSFECILTVLVQFPEKDAKLEFIHSTYISDDGKLNRFLNFGMTDPRFVNGIFMFPPDFDLDVGFKKVGGLMKTTDSREDIEEIFRSLPPLEIDGEAVEKRFKKFKKQKRFKKLIDEIDTMYQDDSPDYIVVTEDEAVDRSAGKDRPILALDVSSDLLSCDHSLSIIENDE